MQIESKFGTAIKCKSVDLLDLHHIVALYTSQQHTNRGIEESCRSTCILTTAFGIPLFSYSLAGKIIAYSMVSLNEDMQNDYTVVADEQYIDMLLMDEVVDYTRTYYEKHGLKDIKLHNAIHRFVDWLNSSKR